MTELFSDIYAIKDLIKEDDWHNIPGPVRQTCDGIINFSEIMALKIINNATKSNDKVKVIDQRLTKMEQLIKSRFENMDIKLDREFKKIKDMNQKTTDYTKSAIVNMEMASQKVSRQTINLEEKLIKLNEMKAKTDDRMKGTQDLAERLVLENKKQFQHLTEI